MSEMLRKHLLDTSRGRIVTLLRAGELTTEDMATELGLTRSAVRIQIAAMERDGVVRKVGKRPGITRPSHLFELTAEVEQFLSKAYVPLLTHLLDVIAESVSARQVETLLRRTGTTLANEVSSGTVPSGSLRGRVRKASQLMNEHLGALTHVESNGGISIHGAGCPLSALTGKHPAVCLAIETFVSEIVGAPVRECCDREHRPRCCFGIQAGHARR